MPIMLLHTLSDILKAVAMTFSTAALKISFCVGILNLVKENVVIGTHLNPDISLLCWQRLTGFYSVIQGIPQ